MARKTFDDLLRESKLPVFVDFYADWCGPCRTLSPVIRQLAEEYSGKLTVVKINVDKQPDVAARYQVQSIPALFLFQNGSVLWRSSGALPLQALKAEISRALGW
ncbi:thioredoxin [Prosthecochloris sp. HL-130-GSB]|jgi:thioredoxin 1|uniref:thioredoxin n=1 Tax=Prosthecochloris sp. HL-130-GSB TaxID=1974213 RepID=UPI000A1C01F9|nr:thioredoxin [Prosthecochloris sp. HL-130-GSB]ARM31078.1 thioredoxin [Prosthecochloris sp. HL-130-GSB]